MPSDKIPLSDDTKLDLSADHVHPAEISFDDAQALYDDPNEDTFTNELVIALEQALNYSEGESKDAIVVITIKAGQ